jgi:hypothetical protein
MNVNSSDRKGLLRWWNAHELSLMLARPSPANDDFVALRDDALKREVLSEGVTQYVHSVSKPITTCSQSTCLAVPSRHAWAEPSVLLGIPQPVSSSRPLQELERELHRLLCQHEELDAQNPR